MPEIGEHIEVTGALGEVIKHFYCIKTAGNFETITQHLSPSLEIMLAFNFGLPVRISFGDQDLGEKTIEKVGVIGPLRKMLNYEVLPGTDMIVVAFNPNGFYRLFQVPVDRMQNETVHDPDTLLGISGFKELWEMLKTLPAQQGRANLLIEYGQAFIKEADAGSQPLLEGIQDLENAFNQPSKAIAVETDLSTRTIQMRFQKYLGFTTKELTRFVRFKQVIDFIQKQEHSVDWLAVVTEFGYHDQSHLIKDFKHYLSTTPRKFVQDFLGKEFCVSKPSGDPH
ncbi:helix-turn-helix domain-containing protein [Dyadobacter sp. CY343]|uniref:helix-turn-helix domain-containing protein n=1 Tax=Dyadobacter sp. CY343 TaxID=2907299 RepID=UPI001F2A521E|nr:helix-turn-helix domain-containing protein [Dyadobacter sp. CY343]MCE7059498.1 helix-turn-helix domain-containing protein [Dyadobacter sp. CY343]